MRHARALSVVVAHAPGAPLPAGSVADAPWFRAIARSCEGLDAELIAVGFPVEQTVDGTATLPCAFVSVPAGAVTPVRWGRGLGRACGRVVAFTTDLCRVEQGWARAAIAALDGGAVAVGGPIRALPTLSRTGRAVHQLRFGRIPHRVTGTIAVDDVAADNAAYLREALLRLDEDHDAGFWEVDANRRLRASGHALVLSGEMVAGFAGGESLRTLMHQRYEHGRHYGSWRVATGLRARWKVMLAAPLVPLVLLGRASRERGGGSGQLPVPEFLALAVAWAAGEAVGAVVPRRSAAS